jgi:hypothetical protein
VSHSVGLVAFRMAALPAISSSVPIREPWSLRLASARVSDRMSTHRRRAHAQGSPDVVVGCGRCWLSHLQEPPSPNAALIARAKSLELNTPYEPPPGDALEHHAGGYARVMCSAVFVTGLDPAFAAENVGYFTAPYEVRAKLDKPEIDRAAKQVHVTMPNGVRRTAKYLGDQGCLTLPLRRAGSSDPSGSPSRRGGSSDPPAADGLGFTPVDVQSKLPDPATQPWPMGDAPSKDAVPSGLDVVKVKQAVDAAFEPAEGMTFVSTLAPAWAADKRPVYGGFFWINGEGTFPVPRDAYYMAGVGGQNVIIVPSHDLVVVRQGHYKGASVGGKSFRRALAMLMEAV